MPPLSHLTASDGARIAYRLDGAADLPLLVLSNSIGTTLHMWDGDIAALSRHFRVLRFDTRGHGESSVPAGDYALERMGRDVLELLDALDVPRAHFLGLSLGGVIGQWLGIHAPQRIDRLVLANTSPWLGPKAQWDERIAAVLQADDLVDTAAGFLRNWFPAHLLDAQAPVVERFRAMLLATDRQGLAGSFAAVRDADLRPGLARIQAPTLVIAGRHDTVTAASHGEQIAAAIPGAHLLVLPAVHLSNIEYPGAFAQAVIGFLEDR
ncbi:3-oxoadipate enol-lactonase [Pseudomonas tohonis]|uniref:3-oxoadipate enol-lactonase n=1 Tax=Pseudomonas tohonis TaxID=2725477 RepID=UPI0021DAFB5C|nr:3-oxoadipate enol-lactonase [Pseudomonas tohonis]UXY55589.1 3-oxoadipate enol-lactonase [Pseudomonas tohonis]